MAQISNLDLDVSALAPVYLVVAALSLMLAARCFKRLIAPIGAMVQVLTAAVVGVLAITLAIVLVVASLIAVLGLTR